MRNKKSTKLIIKRNNWKLSLHKDFLARNCFPKMSNLCFCNKKYGKFLQGKKSQFRKFPLIGWACLHMNKLCSSKSENHGKENKKN